MLGVGRGNSARGAGARVRRVLIAGQVAVAMVLLFGAGLMFRTIARMNSLELGFRINGVMKRLECCCRRRVMRTPRRNGR